jgi:hypothetical protein
MPQPTDELAVRMTAVEWNQVMTVLGEGPFRIVALLLTKIQSQAMAQDRASPQAAGNGEEAHAPHR